MKMKKLMITAAFFAGLVSISFAQQKVERERKTPEQRAQHMTDALEKKLSLTSDQKAQVYQINLERAKKMETMYHADKTEMYGRSENRKALMEDSEKKLNGVLNDGQRKSYQEMKANMKEHHKGKGDKKTQKL